MNTNTNTALTITYYVQLHVYTLIRAYSILRNETKRNEMKDMVDREKMLIILNTV